MCSVGIEAYIKQEVRNPVWSETKWATSKTIGVIQQAEADWTQDGVKLILITIVILNVQGGKFATLSDTFNVPILNMSVVSTTSAFMYVPLNHIMRTSKLRVQIIDPIFVPPDDSIRSFSVGYQTVREKQPQ